MQGNRNQTNDSLRVFKALKNNIMRTLSVCSICKVISDVGQYTQEAVEGSNGNWWVNNIDLGVAVERVGGAIVKRPYIQNNEWYYDGNGTGITATDTSLYRTCQLVNKPNVYIDCFDVSDNGVHTGDIVIVLYTNEDTRENLKRIKLGLDPVEIDDEIIKHNLNYGIIIKSIFNVPSEEVE